MPNRYTMFTQAVAALSRKRVLVGIPMENDPRPGQEIGNASIGYIHEYGSPARGIPPRPHMRPGIEAAQAEISRRLAAAAQATLEGNQSAAIQHLGQAGQAAVNSIKKTIQAGLQPNLQPATVVNRVTGRARREREAGRRQMSLMELAREEIADGSVKPLIDTGDYINSIVWVIKDR
jgi:hypothetical protein